MTRKVYTIPTSLWKGIVILIHNAFLNITNDTMVKFIDSKQSFEIIFITITPSLFFPMLLTKKNETLNLSTIWKKPTIYEIIHAISFYWNQHKISICKIAHYIINNQHFQVPKNKLPIKPNGSSISIIYYQHFKQYTLQK